MNKIHDVLQSVADSLHMLQEHYDTLRKQQQEFDLEVGRIYHEIETTKFNAVDGYKFAKQLQDVLKQRRVVKSELGSAHSAVTKLKPRLLEVELTKMVGRAKQNINSAYEYLGIGQEVTDNG